MTGDRIDLLRAGARDSGFTIDYLEALTSGLSLQATRKVIGNVSGMPSYMKSSDNPYVRRSSSGTVNTDALKPGLPVGDLRPL